MTIAIYWFRNDLRLHDQIALTEACKNASHLLPVYCHDPSQDSRLPWGFARRGIHRKRWLRQHLNALSGELAALGSTLIELNGDPVEVLSELSDQLGTNTLFCEEIAAPEEQAQVEALRKCGLRVNTFWQSTMLDPNDLPFEPQTLPDVFTQFRLQIERANTQPRHPIAKPLQLLPLPEFEIPSLSPTAKSAPEHYTGDHRSSFPYHTPLFAGGEAAAQQHLGRYLENKQVFSYKETRNQLYGKVFSSRLSPWLATGTLSAPSVMAALKSFEAKHGASDGTYWLWFELLWRDYFRFLHLKYGRRLYRVGGLNPQAKQMGTQTHDSEAFQRWCQGTSGQPLVDSGMRELAATGYLSNRMRQIVASYLVYDLHCDWRAGAAWFESQLIDFDIYSNQGNWLYIAGLGTDPRGGRRFNLHKQTQEHDPEGHYQTLWGTA